MNKLVLQPCTGPTRQSQCACLLLWCRCIGRAAKVPRRWRIPSCWQAQANNYRTAPLGSCINLVLLGGTWVACIQYTKVYSLSSIFLE